MLENTNDSLHLSVQHIPEEVTDTEDRDVESDEAVERKDANSVATLVQTPSEEANDSEQQDMNDAKREVSIRANDVLYTTAQHPRTEEVSEQGEDAEDAESIHSPDKDTLGRAADPINDVQTLDSIKYEQPCCVIITPIHSYMSMLVTCHSLHPHRGVLPVFPFVHSRAGSIHLANTCISLSDPQTASHTFCGDLSWCSLLR